MDDETKALIERQSAEIGRLRAALEPFARLDLQAHVPDDALIETVAHEAGDYRRARAALAGETADIQPAKIHDWVKVAKSAGEHGIRYRTNSALESFLFDIIPTILAGEVGSPFLAATAGAYAERARIVEWLTNFDPSFADAIERGDHWKEGGE